MGLIDIVPIEQTFFRVFDKPRGTRLSRRVIRFNYAHLSPFQKGDSIFLQSADFIYAWFVERPAANKNSIRIPEAYLIYRFFKTKQQAIIILERNGCHNVLVIKGGALLSALTMKNLVDLDSRIDLLRREHSLTDPEVIRLEPDARFPIRAADIAAFINVEIKPSELLGKAVSLAKTPLAVSMAIAAAFTLYNEFHLRGAMEERHDYLGKLKRQNRALQESVEEVRGKSGLWQGFIDRELSYPNFYLILSRLSEVVAKLHGYLNTVDFSDDRLTVWTGQKASEAVLIKELLATGLFSEVKIVSSMKDSARPDYTLLNLEITLRPLRRGTS